MRIFIGVCMVFITYSSLACDICNMSVSLSPDDAKNYISVLYRNRYTCKNFTTLTLKEMSSTSRHGGIVLLPTLEDQKHEELFSVYEIQGLYNFTHRFHATVSIPFIQNVRELNDEKQFQLSGIGDPILMAKYYLLRTSFENKMNHRVTVGGGLKIPLGSYGFEHNGEVVEHDIQAGTGTLDFLFSLDYLLKYKKIGVLLNANYKANTQNKKVNYMFGNSLNSTLSVFYMKQLADNYSLLPYVGAYGELAGQDIENKTYEQNTGGNLLFGTVGMQFYFYQFKIDFMFQQLLASEMNGDLQLETKNRFQTGISYLF